MEKLMIFDDKMKTKLGIMCFIPVVCFFLCFVYYLILLLPVLTNDHAAGTVSTITSANYDTLFMLLAASAIITAPVFIYCLVILARMKTMNSAVKLEWFLFLSVMAPIASALFWVFIIRNAPKYVGIYPDIA